MAKVVQLIIQQPANNNSIHLLPNPLPLSTSLLTVFDEFSSTLNETLTQSYEFHYLDTKISQVRWPKATISKLIGKSESQVVNGESYMIQVVVQKEGEKKLASRMRTLEETIQNLSSSSSNDNLVCIQTLAAYTNGLIKFSTKLHEKYGRVRSINMQNHSFMSKVAPYPDAVLFLEALGFEQLHSHQKNLSLVMNNEKEDVDLVMYALKLLQTAVVSFERRQIISNNNNNNNANNNNNNNNNNRMEIDNSKEETSSFTGSSQGFNPYKMAHFNAQTNEIADAPKRYKSKINNELEQLENQAKVLESKVNAETLDRMLTVIIPEITPPSAIIAMENDFISNNSAAPTKSDSALIASRMQRLEEERKKREDGGFTTKAMRDLEKMKKVKVYSHTQLRICFADGAYISARFRPSETIETVKLVVKSVLREEYLSTDFELYTTPPRIMFDAMSSTLTNEKLVPAARIHISWRDKSLNSRKTADMVYQNYLSQNVEQFPEAKNVADELVKEQQKGQKKISIEDMRKAREEALIKRMMGSGSRGSSRNSSKSSKTTSSSIAATSKTPKWLKP